MRGKPLTLEQSRAGRAKASAPDAIKRAAQSRSRRAHARNPVTWLKHIIESTPTVHPIVKARAAKLFADLHSRISIYSLDEQTAQREHDRIAASINQAIAQHRLIVMADTDKAYLTTSKVAAMWLTINRKLNSGKDKAGATQQPRRRVPTAQPTQPARAEDDGEAEDDANGETA